VDDIAESIGFEARSNNGPLAAGAPRKSQISAVIAVRF